MWVEADLHAPSGESVLRQFAHGIRWTRDNLGVVPTVAWLPDTFGFPATFPTLAAHAGVPYFATTKLQWNETTRWPYPRFRWTGDDGSSLIAAVIDSYDGDLNDKRLAAARARDEILVVGYGDGGGGATDADLARAGDGSRGWTRVSDWFEHDVAPSALPDYRGELYLETHRGTYTTHHDVKSRNAALERALAQAEELAAWCVAVRAPETVRRSLGDDLRSAWRIVLRAQFHDVIPGTAIGAVYTDVHAEYDRALAIAARVRAAAVSLLPRTDLQYVPPRPIEPVRDDDGWVFENAYVRARARRDGTIVELSGVDGPNLVAVANGIAAYADTPKRWDAWNVDAGYARKAVRVQPDGAAVEDGGLVVQLRVGKASALSMRHRAARRRAVAARRDRRGLARRPRAAARRAPHRARRARRALRPAARHARAHGVSADRCRAREVRSARAALGARRRRRARPGGVQPRSLRLERRRARRTAACGWGRRCCARRAGPTRSRTAASSGWSTRCVPTSGASISALEHAWLTYAEEDRVRLFTCENPSVLIVATYPSDDASGVIVRVRECDGARAPRGDALRRPHAHGALRRRGGAAGRGRGGYRRGRSRLRPRPVRIALVPGAILAHARHRHRAVRPRRHAARRHRGVPLRRAQRRRRRWRASTGSTRKRWRTRTSAPRWRSGRR